MPKVIRRPFDDVERAAIADWLARHEPRRCPRTGQGPLPWATPLPWTQALFLLRRVAAADQSKAGRDEAEAA